MVSKGPEQPWHSVLPATGPGWVRAMVFVQKINSKFHLCKLTGKSWDQCHASSILFVYRERSFPEIYGSHVPILVPKFCLVHFNYWLTNRCGGETAGLAREVPYDHTCANAEAHKSFSGVQLQLMRPLCCPCVLEIWGRGWSWVRRRGRRFDCRGKLDHLTTSNFSFWQTLMNGNTVRENIREKILASTN